MYCCCLGRLLRLRWIAAVMSGSGSSISSSNAARRRAWLRRCAAHLRPVQVNFCDDASSSNNNSSTQIVARLRPELSIHAGHSPQQLFELRRAFLLKYKISRN